MWENVFDRMLERLIVRGRLEVTGPDGSSKAYGPGGDMEARVRFTDPAVYRRLCLNPELALGEGYMDGTIEVEKDALYDLLALLITNRDEGTFPPWIRAIDRIRFALRRWAMKNTPLTARQNVAHHYDLSDDLYALFLDEDWQYSCAYFARPDMTLEEAQAAKKAHIAEKLMIREGDRVLDIGCGWGGMAITLARDYGARVVGVTLSENQLARARERAEAAGLSKRVEFRLLDYRKLDEPFDRIVSVGMLEHVGIPQYQTYFDQVAKLLAPDGIALIHTIGRITEPTAQSPWFSKYIFPGGYVPSLSELAVPIEKSGLHGTDIEILQGTYHYARTLEHWRRRFEANLDKVRALNDERFIRMWRYYLVSCEAFFDCARQGVFQIQLAQKQRTIPATRDYLYTPPVHAQLKAGE
ncbi:SAM-dependent methyltransferase [Rhodosalinus halophilus]|uniref:SAM-dependent methyltransferase n=1 Tax=Rhodosalinus halophilus TaxID=2259333 RepID=A0A365UAM2_9RHOB|nr:cyclopropane-fatty-acyl-phospholipid synthase family protein [Rhodosalinus halophilus]RBI85498.1 SAM-dependent methyltransferase [Rhodosalinus halophilus]